LRRKTGVEGSAKGVIRMGGIQDRIDMGKEMGKDRRRGSKLKGGEGSRMRNGVRG
jgi:hypothetical protein